MRKTEIVTDSQTTNTPAKRRFILPPVVLLAAVLTELALHAWLPMAQLWNRPIRFIGIGLIGASLGANIVCVLEFRRRRTTVVPFQEPTELITDGPYRVSRNPIYLSMVALLLGEAIALGSLSPWMVPPAFLWIIRERFVRVEERMLSEKFGERYRDYCRRVRRWL